MHVDIEEIAWNVVHKYIKVIDDQFVKHAQSWRESLKVYNMIQCKQIWLECIKQ